MVYFDNIVTCWFCFLTINDHTTSQRTKVLLGRNTFDTRQINLVNLITWVNHLIGKVTIISQNKKPRRIPVKTTNRIDTFLNVGHEINHRLTIFLIRYRRNNSSWFIKKIIDLLFIINWATIYLYNITIFDNCCQFRNGLTI